MVVLYPHDHEKTFPCRFVWAVQIAWVAYVFKLYVKGIVHPKMKIWCLYAYPKGIQDVGDFVSSVEHKQRFLTQTVAVCQ